MPPSNTPTGVQGRQKAGILVAIGRRTPSWNYLLWGKPARTAAPARAAVPF